MKKKNEQMIRDDNLKRVKEMTRLIEKYKDVSVEDINAQIMEMIKSYAKKRYEKDYKVANQQDAYEKELKATRSNVDVLQHGKVGEDALKSMKLRIEENKKKLAEETVYWEEKIVQEKKRQQEEMDKMYETGKKIRRAVQKVANFFKRPFSMHS